jgi:hypothetical protein
MEIEKALQLWEQAGFHPSEVLKEQGVYDDFLNYLYENPLTNSEILSRGVSNIPHEIGTIVQYNVPTSWSLFDESAFMFISGMKNAAILDLKIPAGMPGIVNTENTYDEGEVILAPLKLKIVDVQPYEYFDQEIPILKAVLIQ